MGATSPTPESRQVSPAAPLPRVYWLPVAAVGAALIAASNSLAFINQGDWARAVGGFLGRPIDGLTGWNGNPFGAEWSFREFPARRLLSGTSSAMLFRLHAAAQWLVRESFSLIALAVTAKLILLALAERLGQRMAALNALGPRARFAGFVLFAAAIFAAHNIALMNTFYQEYALFLFLPVVAVALMSLDLARWRIALMLGALACGLAKPQFFYVPLLVAGVLWYQHVAYRRRLDGGLLGALLLIQAVCVIPLLRHSEYAATNRYHAMFLGAYLVMTEAEIDALGLTPEERACIGVDAWGNRVVDATATQITGGHRSCVTREALPFARVVGPYLANPALLVRLLRAVSPDHFSSAYFHVSRDNPYLTSIRADGRLGAGAVLQRMSSVRDQWFLHGGFLLTTVLGLALPLGPRRRVPEGVAAVSLLLVAFASSQVVVCILGEGVRDLARHLSAAQYAMDLLLAVVAIQAACLVATRVRVPPSPSADRPRSGCA